MSWWVKFNLVVFLIILVLTLFLRFLGSRNPQSPMGASPSPSPSSTPTASESATVQPEVLGMATDSAQNAGVAALTVYESSRLDFMTMVPAALVVTNDVVRIKPNTDAAPLQLPSCTFSPVLAQQSPSSEPQNLAAQALPLISVQEFTVTEPAAIAKIYILKDEEGTAQLQLNCTKDWSVTEDFYALLRAVRFL